MSLALLFTLAVSAQPFEVAPPASWVEVLNPDFTQASPDDLPSGVYSLLIDEQVRAGKTTEHYRRSVRRLTTSRSVEMGSEISIAFDPKYQKLIFHEVKLIRGSVKKDALDARAVKIIQQESELDARMYNERKLALLFVNDVRPGDMIDYSYTLIGENPVLGPRFTDEVVLGSALPTGRIRYRLTWPKGRKLNYRAYGIELEPRIVETSSTRDFVWDVTAPQRVEHEDGAPLWYQPVPWLQLSEFDSWDEVRSLVEELFAIAQSKTSTSLAAQLDLLRGQEQQTERVFVSARFVQDEIRYLGMEMGRNSHEPHPPSETLDRRFGDCKDKALLLATMLKGLGIEAAPALVSTTRRRALDALLPSPTLFDHAIVRVKLDGREMWIDATQTMQGGSKEGGAAPPFERALVLGEKGGLTEIAARDDDSIVELKETYAIKDYQSPVALEVREIFRGRRADAMRNELAGTSRSELGRWAINYYSAKDHQIESAAPIEVLDNLEKNELVLVHKYLIPEFWDGVRRDFYAYTIKEALDVPSIKQRKLPFSIDYPGRRRHVIVLNLPEIWDTQDETETIDGVAFTMRSSVKSSGKVITLEYAYEAKSDFVPPEKITEYLRDVDHTADALGYWIAYSMTGKRTTFWGVAGPLSIVGGALVFFFGFYRLRDYLAERPGRVRKDRFRKNFEHGAGDSPATAIRISSEAELVESVQRRPCPKCGKKKLSCSARDSVLFGGKELAVGAATCASCQERTRVYFDIA